MVLVVGIFRIPQSTLTFPLFDEWGWGPPPWPELGDLLPQSWLWFPTVSSELIDCPGWLLVSWTNTNTNLFMQMQKISNETFAKMASLKPNICFSLLLLEIKLFLFTWYLCECVRCACIRVAMFICFCQCVTMNVSTCMCVSVCVCVSVCLSALGCFMHASVSFCVWMLGSTAYWWVGLRGISCGCSQPSTTILMSFELGTYSCTLDLPCWTMLFSCLLGSAWFNCAICSWEDLNALQMER